MKTRTEHLYDLRDFLKATETRLDEELGKGWDWDTDKPVSGIFSNVVFDKLMKVRRDIWAVERALVIQDSP